MSGFVGVLNTDSATLDPGPLNRMVAAMAFRGPDAQRTWAGERLGSDTRCSAPRRDPPTLHTFGTVGDLTRTLPSGPNFDGGGGANIYAS